MQAREAPSNLFRALVQGTGQFGQCLGPKALSKLMIDVNDTTRERGKGVLEKRQGLIHRPCQRVRGYDYEVGEEGTMMKGLLVGFSIG